QDVSFQLFTDGSASKDGHRSGYSVIALLKVGAVCTMVGIIGEQLVGNADTQWPSTGALALDAEQIAIATAILWTLQMRALIPKVRCQIWFDCQAAGYAASGQWTVINDMGSRLRNLALMADQVGEVSIEYGHVKAHAGNGWNEVADAVAKALSCGNICAQGPPDETVKAFLELDLAWAGFNLRAARDGSSRVAAGQLWWNESQFRPYQLTVNQLIPTSAEDNKGIGTTEQCFRLRACTANVQGLTGHYKYVEEQLDRMAMNVVFLQETKGHSGICQSSAYLRLSTEACRHFGVAVWFHRRLGAMQIDGVPLVIQEEDIEVLAETPRLLTLVVRKDGRKFGFIAGHCPHSGRAEERDAFLEQLASILHRLKRSHLVLCGIDLNGRVQAPYELVCGTLTCDDPDATGQKFTETLASAGMWIPSTYNELHQRDPYTYCHPSGNESRIDYVVVGGRANIDGAGSETCQDFDNGSPNEDHRLAALTLEGRLQLSQGRPKLWRPVYDRDKLATPEGAREQDDRRGGAFAEQPLNIGKAEQSMTLKVMIAEAKDKFLRQVAAEGHQNVTAVLQRARKAGVGGRNRRPVSRPLPRLIDPKTGEVATTAADRDKIWLQFFGEQEQGKVIPTDSLIQQAGEWQDRGDSEWSWELLPSTAEIEAVFRRTPKGKAGGIDAIPSDLLATSPGPLAQLLQPLYLKSLLAGRQPLQWRGGILYEAYKNSG
ncbi:unnamed protein product, partial [Symbiodinium necroappetens]